MHRLTAISRVFALGRVVALAGGCGFACAQSPVASLEQAATKVQQQWFGLASSLDSRLTRLLPCDKAAEAAIEEIHRASTERMIALIQYTNAIADQAAQDTAMARRIQRAESDYAMGLGDERIDTEQERAIINSQLAGLADSVRKRVSLTVANDELRALEASVRDRVDLVTANVTASVAVLPKFESLVRALELREAVLRKQIPILEDERAKWNGYYTARLARVQVECSESGR